MNKTISVLTVAAALAVGTVVTQAQSLGLQTVYPLSPFALAGSTTNNFAVGSGATQVFISAGDVDYLPMQLTAITGTNGVSPSVPETIFLTYSPTVNGTFNDATNIQTISLLANTPVASTNQGALTQPASKCIAVDARGITGIFILNLWSTNAPGTATNYVTLQVFPKAPKLEAVPSTFRN